MATTRAVGGALVPRTAWASVAEAVARRMEGLGGAGAGGRAPRYFTDKASGRVLSEEERAAENVYIQVTGDSPTDYQASCDRPRRRAIWSFVVLLLTELGCFDCAEDGAGEAGEAAEEGGQGQGRGRQEGRRRQRGQEGT